MRLKHILFFSLFVLIGMLCVSSINAVTDADLRTDIESYWTFDNVLSDSTGNGNTGTVSGAVYTSSGKINGCYDFDGSDDTIKTSSSLGISSAITVSAWIYWNGRTGTTNMIVNEDDGSNRNWQIAITNSNVLYFRIFDGGSFYDAQHTEDISGGWHHVLGTYDGSNVKLYLDGNLKATTAHTGNIDTDSEPVTIGNRGDGGTRAFDGKIDEVGIWSRALTLNETLELYNSGDGLQYPYTTLFFENISVNNETLINDSYFNTSDLDFYVEVLNSSTNEDFNVSYFVNGFTPYYSQFINNGLNDTINFSLTETSPYNEFVRFINTNDNNNPKIDDILIGYGNGYSDLQTTAGAYCDLVLDSDNSISSNSQTLNTDAYYWNGTDFVLETNVTVLDYLKATDCEIFSYDGTWNISFYAENNETNVTSSTYTFKIDTTSPVIDNNIPAESNSYTINLNSSSCTDTNLYYCNISIDGENVALNSTNVTVTHNGNISYTITAIDLAGNTVTENGVVLVNPIQYVRVYDNLRSVYVEDYSINGETATGEYYSFNLYDYGLGNQSFDFSKFGYNNETFYLVLTNTSDLNTTFNVTPVTITIKIYDASTNNQIYFNATMINSTDSNSYLNQYNFSLYYNESITGETEILISSTGYSGIKFYPTISPYTSITYTGYMFNLNDTETHTFTVQDVSSGLNLENVLVEVQDIINGSYVTLSQGLTSNGKVYFSLNPAIEYKVIFSKDGYVSTSANTIPGTLSYTVKLTEDSTTYDYIEDISYKFTPSVNTLMSNNTYNLTGFISGTSLSSVTFTLTLSNGTVLYTSTSTNPTGSTFVYEWLIPYDTNISSVVASLRYVKDGNTNTVTRTYNIISLNDGNWFKSATDFGDSTDEEDKITRWIIIMLVTVIVLISGAMAGVSSGVSLLIIPVFVLFSFIGWISWIYAGVIIFVALIMFIGGRK